MSRVFWAGREDIRTPGKRLMDYVVIDVNPCEVLQVVYRTYSSLGRGGGVVGGRGLSSPPHPATGSNREINEAVLSDPPTRPPPRGADSQVPPRPIIHGFTYQSSGSQSLNPLANGLLAIFSCVICGNREEKVDIQR